MAYTALYRKWRPATFEEVREQDAVVTTLRNQINSGRIGHAYLFCGTRGTGKTSIAKIFARAVNCEHPVNGSPCNTCATCQAILSGSSMNVVEIDAASNNGVDNIREIRDEVKYSPTEGKYRVYIIDEVHMLSAGAYNALLKTLEEPPSYVIFILATTEVHKIPITVLSRCQRYDFKRISTATLYDQLQKLTKAEGIPAEEQALRYIARAADGAMRDALSILEQCVAFHYGELLTYGQVLEVVGAVDTEIFEQLLACVIQRKIAPAMKLLDDITFSGRDLGQFVSDFVWYMRNLLMLQTNSVSDEDLGVAPELLPRLRQQAMDVSMEELMRYIRHFSGLNNQMRYSSEKRAVLEVAVLRLMYPQMQEDMESLQERIIALEQKLAAGIPVSNVPTGGFAATIGFGSAELSSTTEALPDKEKVEGAHMSRRHGAVEDAHMSFGHGAVDGAHMSFGHGAQVVELEPADYDDWEELRRRWPEICQKTDGLLRGFLPLCRLSYQKDQGFVVAVPDENNWRLLSAPERVERLEETATAVLGKQCHLKVILSDEAAEVVRKGKMSTGNDLTQSIPGIQMPVQVEPE